MAVKQFLILTNLLSPYFFHIVLLISQMFNFFIVLFPTALVLNTHVLNIFLGIYRAPFFLRVLHCHYIFSYP